MAGYAAVVLADNPVHYWRLNEQAGQIAWDSGSVPHPLRPLGSTWHGAEFGYSGPDSSSGAFLPASDSFTTSFVDAITAPFSIEFWFWILATFGSTAGLTYDQTGNGVALQFTGGAGFRVAATSSVSGSVLSIGSWHHMAGVDDGINQFLYVDGVQVATAVPPGGAHNGAPDIGQAADRSCVLSEVAFYGHALTAARVLAHYNAADQLAARPVKLAGGSLDAEILASVKRTYFTG